MAGEARPARHVQLLQPANAKDRRADADADAADNALFLDDTPFVTLEHIPLAFCSASVMLCLGFSGILLVCLLR